MTALSRLIGLATGEAPSRLAPRARGRFEPRPNGASLEMEAEDVHPDDRDDSSETSGETIEALPRSGSPESIGTTPMLSQRTEQSLPRNAPSDPAEPLVVGNKREAFEDPVARPRSASTPRNREQLTPDASPSHDEIKREQVAAVAPLTSDQALHIREAEPLTPTSESTARDISTADAPTAIESPPPLIPTTADQPPPLETLFSGDAAGPDVFGVANPITTELPPDIVINIGRIDVRAGTSEQPRAMRPKRERPPMTNLTDYLQQGTASARRTGS